MCVILKDKNSPPTFAGCLLDARAWRDYAPRVKESTAAEYLIRAAATVEYLAKYLFIKNKRGY